MFPLAAGTRRNFYESKKIPLPAYSLTLVISALLLILDPASLVVVIILSVSAIWGVIALSRNGQTSAVPYWIAGLILRIAITIIQTGNQLILVPYDSKLYESQGRLIAEVPVESWYGWLNNTSTSTRGIIALHGLFSKLAPVFRPGIYVALLSVAASSLAVAMVLPLILQTCTRRFRKIITVFLSLSPAFAFWSSQNTKEGFVCFGLSLFSYGALQSKNTLHVVAGVGICWIFRPYIGAIALASAVAAYGYSRTLARREQTRPVLLAVACAIILAIGLRNGSSVVGRDVSSYTSGVIRTGGGSLDTGVFGLSASSPLLQTIRTVLTPPPWFVPRSAFDLVSIFEGLVIGVVLVAALRRFFGSHGARDFATITTFLTTFLVCAIYGLGPNIGTNVRIRTTVYPLVFALYARSMKRVEDVDLTPRTGPSGEVSRGSDAVFLLSKAEP
jgi:hypothetical protein